MLETTIAGSLPKPVWLAETRKLWPAWRLESEALADAKRDATILLRRWTAAGGGCSKRYTASAPMTAMPRPTIR